MTEEVIIYHNGECSKSKGALEILQEENIPHQLRWYLTDPLSKTELIDLLKKLGKRPSEIIRRNEPVYKELFENKELTEDEWLDALIAYPVLMERPIIEKGEMAFVARPPEIILQFLSAINDKQF